MTDYLRINGTGISSPRDSYRVAASTGTDTQEFAPVHVNYLGASHRVPRAHARGSPAGIEEECTAKPTVSNERYTYPGSWEMRRHSVRSNYLY
jgi:hypothetical protein